MTFLTRTIAGGGESQASLLLVERGGSKYRPMHDEDISENVHLGLQNNSKSTTRSRTTSGSIRNEESDNVHTKKTTDPTPSSPSSSLSSSWSSSFEASSARSFQPHHQQQQQPKKQEQQRHHRQQQQSAFSSPFSPKTSVAKRLDESAAAATAATFKQVNRSADLVPLTHEYDKMKRRLRSLIASTKQYHDAMARMHRARMEVVLRLAAVSSNTPLHEKIGGINKVNVASSAAPQTSNHGDSLAFVHKLGFTQCRIDAGAYQESIVAYIVEWESVICTRVDASLDRVHDLQQKLHHYQHKVGALRKKVHGIENSSSGSGGSIMSLGTASQLLSGVTRSTKHINASSGIPVKLEEKLARNQQKLERAWKEHESAASTLCHLLEEVTSKGWKDLAPLLDKAMEWECERSMHDCKVFARLTNLRQETIDLVQRLNNADVLFDSPSSCVSNGGGGDGVGAHASRGPTLDFPVMVSSSNKNVDDETELSGSYAEFYPDDEAGSIESPPRSQSCSGTMDSSRQHQMAGPSSSFEASSTSFFDEMSNGSISLLYRNNNKNVNQQATCSPIAVETIE